jgi:hypothetical protein
VSHSLNEEATFTFSKDGKNLYYTLILTWQHIPHIPHISFRAKIVFKEILMLLYTKELQHLLSLSASLQGGKICTHLHFHNQKGSRGYLTPAATMIL